MTLRVAPEERFSTGVEGYARFRPSYPEPLFDWLAAETGVLPPARVADIGCGTGISTRQLVERGYRVIGIDPNEAMLAEARRANPDIEYRVGASTGTGLDDASVDLVTAAQAFHWFDIPRSLDEIKRVLRPGGSAAAFWNGRGHTPPMREYHELLLQWSAEYRSLRDLEDTLGLLRTELARESTQVVETRMAHPTSLDWKAFWGRVHSSSYVTHGVDDHPGFERALQSLFAEHASEGRFPFAYETTAIAWRWP